MDVHGLCDVDATLALTLAVVFPRTSVRVCVSLSLRVSNDAVLIKTLLRAGGEDGHSFAPHHPTDLHLLY